MKKKASKWKKPKCEECGSLRLSLEIPPDFEEFEVCKDCGHIQGAPPNEMEF